MSDTPPDYFVAAMRQLNERFDSIDARLSTVEADIHAVKRDLAAVVPRVGRLEATVAQLVQWKRELTDQRLDEKEAVTKKLDDLEDRSRRSCLVFIGLRAAPGVSCEDVVADFVCRGLGIPGFTKDDLERAHPLGGPRGKDRPIIARFRWFVKRQAVLDAARFRREAPFVRESFSGNTRTARRILHAFREEQHFPPPGRGSRDGARIIGNKLVYGERTFFVNGTRMKVEERRRGALVQFHDIPTDAPANFTRDASPTAPPLAQSSRSPSLDIWEEAKADKDDLPKDGTQDGTRQGAEVSTRAVVHRDPFARSERLTRTPPPPPPRPPARSPPTPVDDISFISDGEEASGSGTAAAGAGGGKRPLSTSAEKQNPPPSAKKNINDYMMALRRGDSNTGKS